MLVEMGEQTRFLDFCWENTKKWQFSKEEGGGGGMGRGENQIWESWRTIIA